MNSIVVPGATEARAQELIDATTTAIFSHMSTVLSVNHQDLLAFLLALQRLQARHKLTDVEMSLWMGDRVTGKLQSHVESTDDVGPHGLSQQVSVVYICSLFSREFAGLLH